MKRVPVKGYQADKMKVVTEGATTYKMIYKTNFGGVTLQGRKMMKDEGHYTEKKSEI